MKTIQSIILPAVVTGVALLITSGLAAADNVFVVNNGNSTVSEISNGVVSNFITTDLASPTGIAIASDGDFVVANNAGYIEEYSPGGTPIEQYFAGPLNNPRGITFDSAGNLYVATQGSHQIVEIPVGGGSDSVIATGFSAINGLAFSNGTLYATDGGAGTVDSVVGGVITPIVTGLSSPNGITFDAAGNLMYVVQHGNSEISEFTVGGVPISNPFISQTSAMGPKTIAIDSQGDFFVTDYNDSTVTEYDPTGAILLNTFQSSDLNGPCFVVTQVAVPEPATYALLFAGLGIVYFMNRRRKVAPVSI
jgi:sugar lactone lactonase YvrE